MKILLLNEEWRSTETLQTIKSEQNEREKTKKNKECRKNKETAFFLVLFVTMQENMMANMNNVLHKIC